MASGTTEEAYSHGMILATPKIVKLVELIIDNFELIFDEPEISQVKNVYKNYSEEWEKSQEQERLENEVFEKTGGVWMGENGCNHNVSIKIIEEDKNEESNLQNSSFNLSQNSLLSGGSDTIFEESDEKLGILRQSSLPNSRKLQLSAQRSLDLDYERVKNEDMIN